MRENKACHQPMLVIHVRPKRANPIRAKYMILVFFHHINFYILRTQGV